MLKQLAKCIAGLHHAPLHLCLIEQQRSLNLKTFNYFDVTWWKVGDMPHAYEIIFSMLTVGFILWGVYSLRNRS
jgi:hypothetical protein